MHINSGAEDGGQVWQVQYSLMGLVVPRCLLENLGIF